jgi:hypothetical protein
MTLWPAGGLLLVAAVLHALAMSRRNRALEVILHLASAAAAAGAFWLLFQYH